MMTSFETAFAFVLGAEGSWSANPNDPGDWTGGHVLVGELHGTKYGISAAAHPDLDIQNLTLGAAEAIYRSDYWAKVRGDELDPRIALVVFDCAVNQGPDTAVRILQKVSAVLVDGIFGPKTMAAVLRAPVEGAVTEYLAQRAVAYAQLTTSFEIFGLGWMRRLFHLANAVNRCEQDNPGSGMSFAGPKTHPATCTGKPTAG